MRPDVLNESESSPRASVPRSQPPLPFCGDGDSDGGGGRLQPGWQRRRRWLLWRLPLSRRPLRPPSASRLAPAARATAVPGAAARAAAHHAKHPADPSCTEERDAMTQGEHEPHSHAAAAGRSVHMVSKMQAGRTVAGQMRWESIHDVHQVAGCVGGGLRLDGRSGDALFRPASAQGVRQMSAKMIYSADGGKSTSRKRWRAVIYV